MRTTSTLLGLVLTLAGGCTGQPGPAGPQGPPGPEGQTGEMGTMGTMGTPGAPGASPLVAPLPVGDARCPEGGTQIVSMATVHVVCNGATGMDGMDGPPGPVLAGLTAGSPAMSCADARDRGLTRSGVTWIMIGGVATEVYCDQTTNGGGWALLYNSVVGVNTTQFWNIPYAERLGRRGRPSLDSNFYDGSLYAEAAAGELMDVFEDLRGQSTIAVVADVTAFDPTRMRISATFVSGNMDVFDAHVDAGWSAPDRDEDTSGASNCATSYNSVTQHYGACWNYNLGSDADTPTSDGFAGPHVHNSVLTALALTGDGSTYSRVRRISRFVRW